jgi:hypothetical protein
VHNCVSLVYFLQLISLILHATIICVKSDVHR